MTQKTLIRSIAIGLPAVLLFICVLAILAIHTAVFRNFLGSEIRQQAYDKTGAHVEVGTIEIPWTRLAVILRDVVVRGAPETPPAEPLARTERVEVGLRALPLLRGRVQLSDLILDRPVIRIRVDSNGHSNLPVAPQTAPSGSSDLPNRIFNFEIGDCAIRSGELYYNDAHTPLNAELHALSFQSAYHFLSGEYQGSVAYENGRVASASIEPLAHSLRLDFRASRSAVSLDRLLLTVGKSQVDLTARLTNYESPAVEGKYQATVFPEELAAELRASAPAGQIETSGVFGYHAGGSRTFVAALSMQGDLRSDALALRTNQRSLRATRVSADYKLNGATLSVENIGATIFGGRLRGNAEMLHIDAPKPASRFVAVLQGASLDTASNALAPRNVRRVPLAGTVNLEARGAWGGPIDTLVSHARLTVASSRALSASPSAIPVNGLVQADYDGPQKSLSFDNSYLQTASTKVAITGTLRGGRGSASQIQLAANTNDLREVTSIAELIRQAISPSRPSREIDLGGTAALTATITGTVEQPQVRGHLTAGNLSAGRSRWRSLALDFDASPSHAGVRNGVLVAAGKGEAQFSGSAALIRWSPSAQSALALQASLANLSVADVMEMAQLHEPVNGTLSGNVSLSGTEEDPQGQAKLAVVRGSAWSEPFDSVALNADFRQRQVQSSINVKLPAGAIAADASYSLSLRAYALKLEANGIQLARIALIQSAVPVSGALNISATGNGTLDNPELNVKLTVPDLRVQDETISGMAAQVSVAHNRAEITVHAGVDQGTLDARGDVALTGAHDANLSLDIRSLPAAALLARFLPTQSVHGLSGHVEAHLTAKGPLSTPTQMEARLEVPPLTLKYADAQISMTQALEGNYHAGVLTIGRTRIEGPGTTLTLGGEVPIRGGGAYTLSADGDVDLSVIQKFDPQVHSSGHMDVHLTSGATPGQLDLRGSFSVKDAVLSSDSIPVGIEGLNAQVNLTGNRADIVNFSGVAGGGNVAARGFFIYGKGGSFNIALDANSVRIRYPTGLRSVLNAQLALQGSPAGSALTGRVSVDRLSFTQEFDLSTLGALFASDSSSVSSPFARNMQLNVAIQSAQDLSLANSKISMAGSANLRMTGTLENPVVLGRIALTGGDVFYLSKRFEVQGGTISFANPAVNLLVTTTVESYDVTMKLSGPIDRLRTDFTSSPSLPPADIIHLLAFGNTNEEANAQPSQSAQMGAESVLASGVSGQVAGRLENVTGLSQITLDPLATNSQGNPGAQVAIQERVTGSILFTFSTDVTSTQYSSAEVQYQLNKKLSVSALRDQNGGYGLDLRYHKVF